MTYKELKRLYDKKIMQKFDILPVNSFNIANMLNLRVKNSIECKLDFKEKYPLTQCNAFIAIFNGEEIIYHDEKYPYKNFSVAHEIAHHLLEHKTDGIEQHKDANLLAAIIVAPVELIKKHKIKSALQLAEQCKIPINVAESYWLEIFPKSNTSNLKNNIVKYGLIVASTSVLVSIIFSIIYANNFLLNTNTNNINNTLINQDIEETTKYIIDFFKDSESNSEIKTENVTLDVITETTSEILNDDSDINNNLEVFITKTGKKYHRENCKYIKKKTNVTKITIKDAQNLQYTPCSICF